MTHDQLNLMADALGNARRSVTGSERDGFDLAVHVVAGVIAVLAPRYDAAGFVTAAGAETDRDRVARTAVRQARGITG